MLKRMWCRLFHGKWTTASPLYHSYMMRCKQCGTQWISHD